MRHVCVSALSELVDLLWHRRVGIRPCCRTSLSAGAGTAACKLESAASPPSSTAQSESVRTSKLSELHASLPTLMRLFCRGSRFMACTGKPGADLSERLLEQIRHGRKAMLSHRRDHGEAVKLSTREPGLHSPHGQVLPRLEGYLCESEGLSCTRTPFANNPSGLQACLALSQSGACVAPMSCAQQQALKSKKRDGQAARMKRARQHSAVRGKGCGSPLPWHLPPAQPR